MIKFVKDLAWMEDYIETVSYLLPKLKQLKKVSSMKGNKERWQHCHGLITYFDRKSFRISLYTTYHDMINDRIADYSTIDLLCYLAHELSHLEHWNHTTSHKMLEATIIGIFMNKLSGDGYISEEQEKVDGLFYKEVY